MASLEAMDLMLDLTQLMDEMRTQITTYIYPYVCLCMMCVDQIDPLFVS